MIAITAAASHLQSTPAGRMHNVRNAGAVPMCAGAIILGAHSNACVRHIDPKARRMRNALYLTADKRLNHIRMSSAESWMGNAKRY